MISPETNFVDYLKHNLSYRFMKLVSSAGTIKWYMCYSAFMNA